MAVWLRAEKRFAVQRQLSQGCLAVGPAYYSFPSSLFWSGCYIGLKIFLFSLVCSLLLLLLSALNRWMTGAGLVITVLHNQLVLNLVKIHVDVFATHFGQPPVFKVEVLVLPELPASVSNKCLIFIPSTYLGTLALNFLKPCFKALVEEPGFFLQFYGCQILLVTLLLIVERKKQSFQVKTCKVCCLRIHWDCRVRIVQPYSHWLLRINHFLVPRFRLIAKRRIQHIQSMLLLRHLFDLFHFWFILKDALFFFSLGWGLERREILERLLILWKTEVWLTKLWERHACRLVNALECKRITREKRGGNWLDRIVFALILLSTLRASCWASLLLRWCLILRHTFYRLLISLIFANFSHFMIFHQLRNRSV